MPTILLCLLIFIIWLSYKKSKVEKAQNKITTEFWDREQKANTTRKKDLSSLHYITIPFDSLPFHENPDEETAYVQQQIKNLADKKIVNLSSQSNTDLKLAYGTANINVLTDYDQNFTVLIRTLNKWGQLLTAQGQTNEAKIVFAYAISIGSDISATYLGLASIYQKEQDADQINALIEKARNLSTPMKDSLIDKLEAVSHESI